MKAITNARIYTMAGKVIENGSVLWKDAKIVAVGADVSIPENVTPIDAKGGTVIPGLINAHSQAGLQESFVGYVAGDDSNEQAVPLTPQLNALVGINPDDIVFKQMVQTGITTVAVAPGNNNLLGGSVVALKTVGATVDEMVMREAVGIKGAMGDAPKSFWSAKGMPPKTRLSIMAMLREVFFMTKDYMQAQETGEVKPPYNALAESLIPLMKREIPLFLHLNRRDDIFSALRLAKEFNIKLVLVNAVEAHLIAERLAQAGVKCIISPGLKRLEKFELKNRQWLAAKTLLAAGVPTAVVPDSVSASVDELIAVAIMMRRAGTSLEEVLETLTIQPAKILGIESRVGSLEVGKDADMVIFEKTPFSVDDKIVKVIINGQIIEGRGGQEDDLN